MRRYYSRYKSKEAADALYEQVEKEIRGKVDKFFVLQDDPEEYIVKVGNVYTGGTIDDTQKRADRLFDQVMGIQIPGYTVQVETVIANPTIVFVLKKNNSSLSPATRSHIRRQVRKIVRDLS